MFRRVERPRSGSTPVRGGFPEGGWAGGRGGRTKLRLWHNVRNQKLESRNPEAQPSKPRTLHLNLLQCFRNTAEPGTAKHLWSPYSIPIECCRTIPTRSYTTSPKPTSPGQGF